MKPAWDALMDEYKGHSSVLIADVDCTAAGKPLCEQAGVKGYPTIKYGDPSDQQDYKGGRDEKALKSFAKTLKPSCSPANLDLCDDAKKAEIAKLQAMSDAELDASIKEKEALLEKAESTFKAEVEKLQKTYEGLNKAKEATIEQVKESGLGLMKAVKAVKAKGGKKEEL
mmetsp:Transcript_39216/g.75169  ORF Transcript_39216/g.75169 Transcript_39216/m.75169 type:complete len:170 (+) Transcript_39216:218-727(+)|eukprot:CAMPEP_0114246028 /NCGR_PEP_ID=MMETSP0058-20121206/12229_1 /TAXON_ID=36894 /ORGANISM="Pyramimonas parkeae, CCMP726" /LENGTH=169 /DNA_ID=CAMNT_0001359157 /DNA_START=205 /DNA_END=714 /DNA_ORIENTATION=+